MWHLLRDHPNIPTKMRYPDPHAYSMNQMNKVENLPTHTQCEPSQEQSQYTLKKGISSSTNLLKVQMNSMENLSTHTIMHKKRDFFSLFFSSFYFISLGLIQCASHALVHSLWEPIPTAKTTHPFNYEVVHCSLC